MPSLSTFRVKFDRPGATYGPGEVVSGRVIVELTEGRNVRGLKLVIKGEGNVHWTEQRDERDSDNREYNRTEDYSGNERYFRSEYNILIPAAGATEVLLPEGYNEYLFDFQLPERIPCSFEHEYGHVRYTVKAIIDRPWKFDHECKAAFTVIAPYDLNRHIRECVGVDDEVHENFYCFCCYNMGSLNMNIKIPCTGFVPGQTIPAQVSFNNQSVSVDVTKVSLKLEQLINFHASCSTKVTESIVKAEKIKGPYDKEEEILCGLQIPPLPPSELQYCSLIEVTYRLKITVHFSGMHCSITRDYPILIGTIPLRFTSPTSGNVVSPFDASITQPSAPLMDNVDDGSPTSLPVSMPVPMPMPVPSTTSAGQPIQPHPSDQANPPIGFMVCGQGSNQLVNWDLQPPSYEECMRRTENIKDRGESDFVRGANEPFAPRYPVFNFPLPYSGK